MIITLTPNTGIDFTLKLSSFQLNSTIRAIDSAWGMGGKATDVSWTLGKLGVPTRALGFAAGPNGTLTAAQARSAGLGAIADQFGAIDRAGRGAIRFADYERFLELRR